MKSLSKKVVLITVILQLKVSIQLVNANPNFEFGDMLAISQAECGIEGFSKHYAIYVDHENIPERAENYELFHMIIRGDGSSGCTFSKLNNGYTVENYLDGKEINGIKIEKQSKEKIIEAIRNLHNNCGNWSLSNTCEHIATSVRYGEAYAQCNQMGTVAGSTLSICSFLKSLTDLTMLPNASRTGRAAAKAA